MGIKNGTGVRNAISPREEMTSYETLVGARGESLRSVAKRFRENPLLPSQLLADLISSANAIAQALLAVQAEVIEHVKRLEGFTVCVHRAFQYPARLRDAEYPPEVFYYRGDLGLTESRCVSIVGARKCSDEGKLRAARLARDLVGAGYTIVSGLATGIDTAAMRAALDAGGRTIGVIGTPINQVYPKENAELQEEVARDHLLLSQVPFYRYEHEPFKHRRWYFPQRNETMSALSEATIIVEAAESSGTLTQARAALSQNRRLFILNSCFESGLKWPHQHAERGAVRVRSTEDITAVLDDDATVEED